MIAIFGSNNNSLKKSDAPKKRHRRSKADKDKLGQENLSKLNPMAFGIIAVKASESPSNEFLTSTKEVIFERPHALTDKWIGSINRFVESSIKSALLDPPPLSEGDRVSFESLTVATQVPAKEHSQYPMPALICVDERGWKYWFKTSKAHSFSVGSTISFVATVSAHKEGITFMRRPSKIKSVSNTAVDSGEDK